MFLTAVSTDPAMASFVVVMEAFNAAASPDFGVAQILAFTDPFERVAPHRAPNRSYRVYIIYGHDYFVFLCETAQEPHHGKVH